MEREATDRLARGTPMHENRDMTSKPDRSSRGRTVHAADIDESTIRFIAETIRSLRFGSVEITVHDGRVVQLDKRERYRLNT